MKINIIGIGYVGLTCSAFLAQYGNQVICSDTDSKKVNQLKNNNFKCSEPYILDIINNSPVISFTTEYASDQDIYLICVGTPNNGNIPDLSQINNIIQDLKLHISKKSIIILKSTILPGTTSLFKDILGLDNPIYFIPEFLSEGNAFQDYINAEKIIIGALDKDKNNQLLNEFLSFHHCTEIHFTDYITAELTKYANNVMLASRLTTMNQIALIADKIGANISNIEKFVGLDSRIGAKYLKTGLGFGGSCLEKDLIALNHISHQEKDSTIFSNIIKNNRYQTQYFADKIINQLKECKNVVLTGITFKNNTDDCRNSCAAYLLSHLLKANFKVKIHDTILKKDGILEKFLPEFEKITSLKSSTFLGDNLEVVNDLYEALHGSNALILIQKHEPFELEYSYIKKVMATPIIFDPNKYLNSIEVKNREISYFSLG